jgi:exopolyphosphatase/guanosine-5'-triphosphate,3'-diphosphate pyrophosphatase
MKTTRRAIIDIGTNSVKLLVADAHGSRVEPVFEASEQTRLGRGFYKTHCLQPEAIELTARVVAAFACKASEWGAEAIRVAATSATRDAHNREELSQAVWNAAQVPLEVISGEEEAELTLKSVTADSRFLDKAILVVEVGGGSTQILHRSPGNSILWRHSFRLGAVRLLEHIHPSDPPSQDDLARCQVEVEQFIAGKIQPKLPDMAVFDPNTILVGIGGTSVCLAMLLEKMETFDPTRLDRIRMGLEAVSGLVLHLWGMPLAERKQLPGLPPPRADVILTGSVIYEALMKHFDLRQMQLSVRGWRFAALMDAQAQPDRSQSPAAMFPAAEGL